MSHWTYVNGNIVVDTFSQNAKKKVLDLLKKLPETSGSEGGCNYYVNLLKGKNTSEWNGEKWIGYQTQCSVSIVGELRDTYADTVCGEIKNILQEISKRFDIRECFINVYDDKNDKVIHGQGANFRKPLGERK